MSLRALILFAGMTVGPEATAQTVLTLSDAGDRQTALPLHAAYSWGTTEIDSFVMVSGPFYTPPPAGPKVPSGLTGSVGARATFAQGTALRPHIALEAAFSRPDKAPDQAAPSVAPRFATGFTWDRTNGSLTMDLNAGQKVKDTSDVGFGMNYSLNF